MRKFLIILLLASTVAAFGQDTVTIHHIRFTTTFDRHLHYPVLVHWTVTSSDLCKPRTPRRVERKEQYFKADPLLEEYTRLRNIYLNNDGGYERGHNMDAADNSCDLQQMKECHYFSNITPQTKQLNQNTWGDLEDHTRHLVDVYGKVEVWCGSYGYRGPMGSVTVPAFCWKILKYNNGTVEAYIMPNTQTVDRNHYDYYQATVNDVRRNSSLVLAGIPSR